MPPTPKHPSVRARTNRTSTSAMLTLVHDVPKPDLPDRDGGWKQLTVDWWDDIWASPMAPEYDSSDRHGLFVLAALVDDYWSAESSRERSILAAEIRLQRQCFGLTPIDRRRLQWEIERSEEAKDKGRKRATRSKAGKQAEAEDPREFLRSA